MKQRDPINQSLLISNLRLELAGGLFKADKVSFGRVAEITGIDCWVFQDILHERHIPITIEAESAEVMDRAIARLFGREQ